MKKKKECKQKSPPAAGVSRRDFLSAAGVGTLGVAAAGTLVKGELAIAEPAADVIAATELVPITLRINEREHRLLVEPRWSLLYVLREKLGLTGAKPGCERGECGACTVLMGDQTRYSCMTLALEAAHDEITTLEGLMEGEELGSVQQAFVECDGYQCGYCTPGQILSVEALLRANPAPSLDDIRLGVSGNLCRCGAYPNIFKAAKRAGEIKRTGGES
jgi:xanthine dehydrogenase YagT iron-sulfur-binding subunit